MLSRSLAAGLRRCAARSLAAVAAAVPAAAAIPLSNSAGVALRGLASLCSGGVGSSLASSSLASSGGGAQTSGSRALLPAAARGLLAQWGGVQQLRGRTTSAHLSRKLRFQGGKLKSYSSMKSRFRLTGGGKPKVVYSRPGHVHKRFSKSKRQLFALSGTQSLPSKYARTVRKLGFEARRW